MTTYQLDPTYYCENIVILVEDTLFSVPIAIFEQSEVFQDMLDMPSPTDETMDGSDNKHPLRLDGYLAQDFRQLLRVLLPLKHPSTYTLSPDEWMSVLKLATIWNFPSARQTAISHLNRYAETDPILLLIASKQHDVPEWFVPAVNGLAKRPKALDAEDLRRLQVLEHRLGGPQGVFEFVLRIADVREASTFVGSPIATSSQAVHMLMRQHIQQHQPQLPMHPPAGQFVLNQAPAPAVYPPGMIPPPPGNPMQAPPTPRTPAGLPTASMLASIRRKEFDFTNRICEVFNCTADGKPSAPGAVGSAL